MRISGRKKVDIPKVYTRPEAISKEEQKKLEKMLSELGYSKDDYVVYADQGLILFKETDGSSVHTLKDVEYAYKHYQKAKSIKRKDIINHILSGAAAVGAGIAVSGAALALGPWTPVVTSVLMAGTGVAHAIDSAIHHPPQVELGDSPEAEVTENLASAIGAGIAAVGGSLILGIGGALAGAALGALAPTVGMGLAVGLATKKATKYLLDKATGLR